MSQSEALTMVGVATTGQPELAPGVHLRWAFRLERGFPPHGFMLFRKPSKESEEICLSKALAGRVPSSNVGYRLQVPGIELESRQPMQLVDRFPARGDGQVEVSLDGQPWVRARFGGPMKRVRAVLVALADGRFRAQALWRGVVVDEAVQRIRRGKVAKLQLRFDSIDAVRIDGGPAVLLDLCGEPLFPEGLAGWGPVPDFPYPLGLPLTHPSYPATGNAPENAVNYRDTAQARVVVPNAPPFTQAQLDEAYQDLVALVVPGPPQHERYVDVVGQPADGVDAELDDNHPTVRLYPLQKVLLAALRPVVAQTVGLYWYDANVVAGERWDYLILGFWTSPASVLGGDWQRRLGADRIDFEAGAVAAHGYIVTELSLQPPQALDAPRDVRSYYLPGQISRRSDGGLRDWRNNVGLRWAIEPEDGVLRSRAPVFYELYRAGLGDAAEPGDPGAADYGQPITGGAPILVTRAPAQLSPTWPPGWPQLPMHFIDRGLAEGWYGYRLRSIDLFGRLSSLGDPADWYRWAPEELERVDAILVADRTPPPPPPEVQARALQPLDPYLDRADVDWLNANLTPAERAQDAAALRVEWRWPDDFKEAAPDLDPGGSFRIYFQPDLLNAVGGRIESVEDEGATSRVAFVTDAAHATNALANARLCSRNELFRVVSSTATAAGQATMLVVDNLSPATPALKRTPAPGGASAFFPPGHPAHVDYHAAGSWSVQIHEEPYDTALSSYEVRFPIPIGVGRWFLPLATSENTPIRYGAIGVTAVDGSGNESRVGGPAQIVVLRRTPPAPPPLPPDAERVWATRPDYHGRSAYTFRWHGSRSVRYIVCRALDASVFRHDFLNAEPFVNRALVDVWPAELEDVVPPAVVSRRAVVTAELNAHWDALNPLRQGMGVLPALERTQRVEAAMALYAQLSNDAIRVLASLPSNSPAFSRLVPEPLGHWSLDPNNDGLYEYTAVTEGRGRSRYFYRVRAVDAANNIGPLSLSSPPVYLPDERPPVPPRFAKIMGGNRSATLFWSAHPAALVDRYRIYRTESRDDASDVRLMGAPAAEVAAEPLVVGNGEVRFGATLDVATVERVFAAPGFDPKRDWLNGQAIPDRLAAPTAPANGVVGGLPPADGTEVVAIYRDSAGGLQRTPLGRTHRQWNDTSLVGGRTYYYRLVAVRQGDGPAGPVEIVSTPSGIGAAHAADTVPPPPPLITTLEWVRIDAAGNVYPYADPVPPGAVRRPAVRLAWRSADPQLSCLVQVQTAPDDPFINASGWLGRGVYEFVDRRVLPFVEHTYRVKVVNQAGLTNNAFATATLALA